MLQSELNAWRNTRENSYFSIADFIPELFQKFPELKDNAHLKRTVVKHLDKDSGGAARFRSRFADQNELVY